MLVENSMSCREAGSSCRRGYQVWRQNVYVSWDVRIRSDPNKCCAGLDGVQGASVSCCCILGRSGWVSDS